jgi:CheY-like chemotaxis protein
MENYRILIIDDLESMHEDFNNILIPKRNSSADPLEKLARLLFDESNAKDNQLPQFTLTSAYQGEEGLELVRQSKLNGHPYALAYIDILMPPGLDGIETISKIWKIDPEIQIVICTAYAKYSWEEIREKLGHKDSLFILKKPFDRMEVIQLACALTKKWNIYHLLKQPSEDQKIVSRDFDIDKSIVNIKSTLIDLEKILKRF